MQDSTLESLCGERVFSGIELGMDEVENCFGQMEWCNVLLFTLDGITYKLVENPSDGYRSYCEDLRMTDKVPRTTFPGIKVICSMMPDNTWGKNDCIVINDAMNGKTILEAGTMNYDDYYPYCHFEYTPENMSCNQVAEPPQANEHE